MRGSLRWNSAIPFRYTQIASTFDRFVTDGRVLGRVTLTNAGTSPQRYGSTTWPTDVNPESPDGCVSVDRDGCAGVVLRPGDSCQVEVSVLFHPRQLIEGWFRTPDGTARGAAYSFVRVPEESLPLSTTLVAIPDRGAVELATDGLRVWYRVLRSVDGGPEVEVARGVSMPWTDTDVSASSMYTYRVVPVLGDAEAPSSERVTTGPLPVPVGAEGTFVAVEPVRVLDTRSGLGGRADPVGPGETIRFDPSVGGRQVPETGVSAVLLNVTGTESTAATHLRVWPAGEPRPDTSSVNLVPGRSRANQVVVPVGEDGQVAVFNAAGSTDVVVDVQGFYSTVDGPLGGGLHLTVPSRVMDTRLDGRPLGPGEERWVPLRVPGGVLCCSVAAVDVNITVTAPTADGHLVAWDGDGEAPAVSNVNAVAGQTVANHAVVPLVRYDEFGYPGFVIRNSSGSTHVIVDVQGWYDDRALPAEGLRFAPAPTTRVADTRRTGVRAAAGQAVVVPRSAFPPAVAHVVNITSTEPDGDGHLAAWSGTGEIPPTSTLNFVQGEDSPNLATVVAGLDGGLAVTPRGGATHVLVDHLGSFY